MINSCAQPPVSGAKSVTGPSPELAVPHALQVPATQFGRRFLAATRSSAGRRVACPLPTPDSWPVPARYPRLQLPLTTAEPINDHCPSPELTASLALQQAHIGEVATLGQNYVDDSVPTLGCLAGASDDLADAGLLALAYPGPHGLGRVSLISAGHARHEQLRGAPKRAGLSAPASQFTAAKTPAGHRSSFPPPLPAPGGQPDPSHTSGDADDAGAYAGTLIPGLSRWCQQRQTALHPAHNTGLPIRSPGKHLHPQLRRPHLAGYYRAERDSA
jgi:hypothetical protein